MIISTVLALSGVILITNGIHLVLLQKEEIKIYKEAISTCNNLYNPNHFPKEELTPQEVDSCKIQIQKINDNTKKEKLEFQTKQVEDYLNLKLEINECIEINTIKADITRDKINTLEQKIKLLKKEYQTDLNNQLEQIKTQLDEIEIATTAVNSLFKDEQKQEVIDNINRDLYNNVIQSVNELSQSELKNNYLSYLNKVESVLIEKERQAAIQEEERRKWQEAINNAWIKLQVPHISQNKSGVLNGCEAACLLMALQYKGYLKNMDLPTYATNMPKSDDPNTGFYLDIFGLEPLNVSHWIAPAPLAEYGINSSGNTNIIDATGMSLEQIDNEIMKGNPVIIYLTSRFKEPRNWSNGVPANLHVQLLTGYNTITGQHLITDPWTEDNGSYQWILDKNTIEKIYNDLEKRAVIIR